MGKKRNGADAARPGRLQGVPIIVCETEEEYRSFARSSIKATDVVLEVGCGDGKTTMRLAESGSVVVGIDKSPEQTDSAQKRYTRNNLHFAVGDALDVSTVRKICAAHEIGPGKRELDYVFIDLSSSTAVGVVTKVMTAYEHVLRPKTFVVLNFHLSRLVSNCTMIKNMGTGDVNLDAAQQQGKVERTGLRTVEGAGGGGDGGESGHRDSGSGKPQLSTGIVLPSSTMVVSAAVVALIVWRIRVGLR